MIRCNGGPADERFDDLLAVEEPLEIRVGSQEDGRPAHRAISITMRTPGDDPELAVGFLFTEGIIRSPDQIKRIFHCGRSAEPATAATGLPIIEQTPKAPTNTIRIDLHEGVDVDLKRLERHFYTSSSCGVCGKSSIEALHTGAKKITAETHFKVSRDVIRKLPSIARKAQAAFEKTGGLHASALFDREGTIDVIREDVGRHNAVDKVIGRKFLNGELPLSETILLVSGRASFELVQKALMAGIPILAAVGAPSSLAVDLAGEFNMTLIGFVREDRFNVYSGAERVDVSRSSVKLPRPSALRSPRESATPAKAK